MADLLSHPFRLGSNGEFVKQDSDTDAYVAERIALLLSIRPLERPFVPLFGVDDPAFSTLTLPALQVQTELFDIPAKITNVIQRVIDDKQVEYYVEFEREDYDD